MYLRQFVSERLTAAAEEIFGVFQKTIVEYEEEIDRQRRLLDVFLKPEMKLHRIDLSQRPVCKEEVLDEQLCDQERNSRLDQEDPEPPQITLQLDELCISEEEEEEEEEEVEQLVLKQETDAFMYIPIYEESDHGKDHTLNFSMDDSQRVVTSSGVSAPNGYQQLLSLNPQEGGQNEPEQDPHYKNNDHLNNASNTMISLNYCHPQAFKCDTCEKAFKCRAYLMRHQLVHKCKKSHTCETCGKCFQFNSYLKAHMRIHTGEKPFTCLICGKDFRQSSTMKGHMRIHTGDKPHLCKICGKRFSDNSAFKSHSRVHTGERPYTCKTCGKDYRCRSSLRGHMRHHTKDKLNHLL
ncbi:Zinc finger protein 454 [Liparis tanakae]|uniref:Zinc finger protein 454 n=1 Tax=Liparis tanakae TaxID=230148 RepID=A0A4Z2HZ95_9TELE|nr:Zinc finger protein 454 [Liparis tanakae]